MEKEHAQDKADLFLQVFEKTPGDTVKSKKIGPNGRVVSFIDIGTNSVRLLVVRLNPNHSYTILSRQKQQVRLGEGEFEDDEIQPEAIERLVVVCRKFTDLATDIFDRRVCCGSNISHAGGSKPERDPAPAAAGSPD